MKYFVHFSISFFSELDEYSVSEFEKLLTLIQTLKQENMNILPSIMLSIA